VSSDREVGSSAIAAVSIIAYIGLCVAPVARAGWHHTGMRRRRNEPPDPLGETREFPPPPPPERPIGTPLPGYAAPSPMAPRDNGAARGWMAAFFVLLFGVIAAVVIWLLVLREESTGSVELSTTIVDFGDQDLGKRSAVQTITIDNESEEPARFASLLIEGQHAEDFQVTDETSCAGERALEPGLTCTIGVRFRPRVREAREAQLLIRFSSGGPQLSVTLTGTGVGTATVVLETTRLDLGSVQISKTRTRRFTLTNSGNAPLVISEVSIDGGGREFRLARATDCSTEQPLLAGESCTIAIAFSPGETGVRNATVTIAHDAEGGLSTVELRGEGKGTAEVGVEPDTLDFGNVEVGGTSDVLSYTVTNTGTARFLIDAIAFAPGSAAGFSVENTSTCGPGVELEPGDTCTVGVSFSPSGEGDAAVTLTLATEGGRSTSVELRGSGTAPPEPPADPANP
jgi:hypothetical protein